MALAEGNLPAAAAGNTPCAWFAWFAAVRVADPRAVCAQARHCAARRAARHQRREAGAPSRQPLARNRLGASRGLVPPPPPFRPRAGSGVARRECRAATAGTALGHALRAEHEPRAATLADPGVPQDDGRGRSARGLRGVRARPRGLDTAGAQPQEGLRLPGGAARRRCKTKRNRNERQHARASIPCGSVAACRSAPCLRLPAPVTSASSVFPARRPAVSSRTMGGGTRAPRNAELKAEVRDLKELKNVIAKMQVMPRARVRAAEAKPPPAIARAAAVPWRRFQSDGQAVPTLHCCPPWPFACVALPGGLRAWPRSLRVTRGGLVACGVASAGGAGQPEARARDSAQGATQQRTPEVTHSPPPSSLLSPLSCPPSHYPPSPLSPLSPWTPSATQEDGGFRPPNHATPELGRLP